MSPSFFESICIRDGQAQSLRLHQSRIHRTLAGQTEPSLEEFLNSLPLLREGLFKLRIDYNDQGHILSHAIAPYTPRAIHSLALVDCPDLNYSVKSADRTALEQARLMRPDTDEVIITQNGFLTDTTYSNIVLGDGTRWVTPSHSLLAGTKRQYLLETGAITTLPLRGNDLTHYPLCSLINAMLNPGDILLPTSAILR